MPREERTIQRIQTQLAEMGSSLPACSCFSALGNIKSALAARKTVAFHHEE